jgi:hypothetical protein
MTTFRHVSSRNQPHNDPIPIDPASPAMSDFGVRKSIRLMHLYRSFDEHLSFQTQHPCLDPTTNVAAHAENTPVSSHVLYSSIA